MRGAIFFSYVYFFIFSQFLLTIWTSWMRALRRCRFEAGILPESWSCHAVKTRAPDAVKTRACGS
jgi:hypothetical protein